MKSGGQEHERQHENSCGFPGFQISHFPGHQDPDSDQQDPQNLRGWIRAHRGIETQQLTHRL